MGSNADQLIALMRSDDPFSHSRDDLHATQIAALNERLDERSEQIAALGHRRRELGLGRVESFGDLIPLLFTFDTYRNYPEALVDKGRWPILTKWLQSLSAVSYDEPLNLEGVADVDDWLARLRAAGHFVQVTAGADGKCAFMDQTARDYARPALVRMVEWSTGINAAADMPAFLLIPKHGFNVFIHAFTLIAEAYGRPGEIHFIDEAPMRVADLIRQGRINRQLATGAADADDVRALQIDAEARQAESAGQFERMARRLLELAGERVVIYGVSGQHKTLVDALAALGAPEGLFHADSLTGPSIGRGGALDAASVERIYRQYGTDPRRSMQGYAMSEILTQMPMCEAGRYHVAPWQHVFLVDRDAETALPAEGQVEGRVAIFDFLVEGRWGATLTTDKVTMDHGDCACGRPGPTILDTISRYTDIDNDKLSCAGSIDAYVRGVIQS